MRLAPAHVILALFVMGRPAVAMKSRAELSKAPMSVEGDDLGPSREDLLAKQQAAQAAEAEEKAAEAEEKARLAARAAAVQEELSRRHGKVSPNEQKLIDQLADLRSRVLDVENSLTDEDAEANVRKIASLLKLQRKERELGQLRMSELQKTVTELESRRQELTAKTAQQAAAIHRFLESIETSSRAASADLGHLFEREKLEAPRRKVLANMAERSLKEIEVIKADMLDAEKLEQTIDDERQQLTYLFQDLDEQAGVLALNQQLQSDFVKRHRAERMARLDHYRQLKNAEARMEGMLSQFNSRVELQHRIEAEREAARLMRHGDFAQLKGKLPLPMADGRVVSSFGRAYDAKSQLYIFKKGLSLAGTKGESVKAVSAGRVAYSGELPDYGRVTIIDHGEHYYSLLAHLGELKKKTGEPVSAGDDVGTVDQSGTPVYFEIRDRNIAVNPAQWVASAAGG